VRDAEDRQGVKASAEWRTVRPTFPDFQQYGTASPLGVSWLRWLGGVATHHPFEADIAVGGVRFHA
jgi:hypothetical protein